MGDARNRTVGFFVQWVFRRVRVFKLNRIGYALSPDRIAGIADQAEVVGIDPGVEEFIESVGDIFLEAESLDQVLPAVDALAQHLLPEFHMVFSAPAGVWYRS